MDEITRLAIAEMLRSFTLLSIYDCDTSLMKTHPKTNERKMYNDEKNIERAE